MARVLFQQEIAPRICDLWLETTMAAQALPGQFIGLYPENAATLLPRPISICEVNAEKTALRIVYRIAGQGTAEFSGLKRVTRWISWECWAMGFRWRRGGGNAVFS